MVNLRSHSKPEARGGSWVEPPTPEARAGGREEQPGERGAVGAQAQEGLEELSFSLCNLMGFCSSFNLESFSGMKNTDVFHLLWSLGSTKSLKISLCVSLEAEAGPYPKAVLLFVGCFSCLYFPSLPRLATAQFYPLGLRESHGGWSLFLTNKKWGTQKGFCAQELHRVLFSFKNSPGICHPAA